MKKFYLLLLLSFTFIACQEEEIVPLDESQENVFKTLSMDEAKEFINQIDHSMDQSKFNNKNSESNGFITNISDTIVQEKIINSNEFLTTVPVSTIYSRMNSKIILLRIRGEIKAVVFSTSEHENSTKDSFYGEILITDLQGNFINGFRVHNSLIVSRYNMENQTKNNQNKSSCAECPFSECSYCQLDEVIVEGSRKKTSIPVKYVFIIRTNAEPSDWEYDYTPGGGGGGGTTTTPTVKEEEEVVNELKNPCGSLILAQLELLSSNYELPEILDIDPDLESLKFSQAILNMFNEVTNIDYIVKEQFMNNPELSGFTDPNPTKNSITGKYQITTWFNSQYLTTATRLSTARSMIHESIHAYLVYHQRLNPTRNVHDLVNNYAKANGYPPNDSGVIHHNFMAQFVISIAYNLQLWDRNHGTGGNLGWQYYHDMAWGGLANYRDQNGNILFYDEFEDYIKTLDDPKTLINESTSARSRILNTIGNEAQNNSSAKGDDCP